ncbi:GNAT family N-acetyltransferase [Riemerella anatipestifer]|uniref:GNAT family N-acetyltransferase n=1 Tax=Riemerella anatipestifer TaxID=34085 RepID=UPI001E4C22EE|nr:GNAT family protein [Riemerella anatipestifer]MCD5968355.1 GNAT family N-acetyltransferase [Riemerella anatipestifer]
MMSKNKPTLETERLVLDDIIRDDLDRIVTLLNQTEDFSKNTSNIAYPYEKHHAEFFYEIANNNDNNSYTFAIREKETRLMIGAMGIYNVDAHNKGEIGYWIGLDYWNKGYAKEALARIISFAFNNLKLNKLYASHFSHNLASGKVMESCGMQFEGILKQEILKQGVYLDLCRYSILNSHKI